MTKFPTDELASIVGVFIKPCIAMYIWHDKIPSPRLASFAMASKTVNGTLMWAWLRVACSRILSRGNISQD